ncbi:hypothetical protein BIFADO_01113, partial [Bifidobacterium adolescentis L2-32]
RIGRGDPRARPHPGKGRSARAGSAQGAGRRPRPLRALAGGVPGPRRALVPLQRRQRLGRHRAQGLAVGGRVRLSADLRGRAQDSGQRPGRDRLLPGLRLGRQVHRGVGARGRAGCRGDGRNFDQGLRLRGHGPPRRLAGRRGRAGRRRRRRGPAPDPVPRAPVRGSRLLRQGQSHGRARGLLRGGRQRRHPDRGRPLRRRRRRRLGLLRPHPARRRRLVPGRTGQGCAGLQGALGPARLPAALGPAIWRRRPTSSTRARSARRRWSTRSRA